MELFRFKQWERLDKDGEEVKHNVPRVKRVWLVEGRDQYGDLKENVFTVVAIGN